MHDTGCLELVYWDDPEGWYGEGGGRRVQDGENARSWEALGVPEAPPEQPWGSHRVGHD